MQYFGGGGQSPAIAKHQFNLLFVIGSTLVEEGEALGIVKAFKTLQGSGVG